jgi:hypothetical protein
MSLANDAAHDVKPQFPEVTPVVPFTNKIQHYQLKHSFVITLYFLNFECNCLNLNLLYFFNEFKNAEMTLKLMNGDKL